VVAAFYPIAYLADRLGADAISVRDLTPSGAEPHDLELRPSDLAAIRDARLVLYFGRGFQPVVEDAVRSLPRSQAVDVLTRLRLRKVGAEADPHVWLSPPEYARMARVIASSLSTMVSHRDLETRLTGLEKQLRALDAQYSAALRRCDRREIFTSHDAFSYLAGRYDLTQVSVEGLSPEAEPSARRLRSVADRARQAHATTIYFETLVSPRVAQAIARMVGLRTATLNPIEGLTPDEKRAGSDYFSIMRANLAALVRGLACRP
jgi:zinc transport system substrate-binding protein